MIPFQFKFKPQIHPRTGIRGYNILVSMNAHPALLAWIDLKARTTNISKAEVMRQCAEFIMENEIHLAINKAEGGE